jgi:hypothetical protein
MEANLQQEKKLGKEMLTKRTLQEHYKTMTRDELVLQCMELSTQLQPQILIPKIVAFGSITGILAGVMFILLFC